MILEKFKQLNKRNQYQLLVSNGIFLLRRKSIKYDFLLYELYGFYVEVMYDELKNKVLHLEPFSNTKLLAPYIDKIDISTLC